MAQPTLSSAQPILTPRDIIPTDVLQAAGLGPWIDILTVSILALVASALMAGVLLALLRAAFGAKALKQTEWETAERAWFDLTMRQARAAAKVVGLQRNAAALEAELKEKARGILEPVFDGHRADVQA